MNLAELQKSLLTVARLHRPSDAVPYAFEGRVMARLRASRGLDRWTMWAGVLWRAAPPAVAVMVVVAACTALLNHVNNPGDTQVADLESTLYAGVGGVGDTW